MEDTTETTPEIPLWDGFPVGGQINWPKLKREIHACVAFQRKVGSDDYLCDMSLYATYLYCLASHARGHLHMTKWNIDHPYKFEPGVTKNPRLGRFELKTLGEQWQFIECARDFILHRQDWMKKYNILSVFKDLPVNFYMSSDEVYDREFRNLEARKARLLAKGKTKEAAEVDEEIAGIAALQRFENS